MPAQVTVASSSQGVVAVSENASLALLAQGAQEMTHKCSIFVLQSEILQILSQLLATA